MLRASAKVSRGVSQPPVAVKLAEARQHRQKPRRESKCRRARVIVSSCIRVSPAGVSTVWRGRGFSLSNELRLSHRKNSKDAPDAARPHLRAIEWIAVCCGALVCLWHEADIPKEARHVRFEGG